jgi:hypothetical protein
MQEIIFFLYFLLLYTIFNPLEHRFTGNWVFAFTLNISKTRSVDFKTNYFNNPLFSFQKEADNFFILPYNTVKFLRT